MAGQREEYTVWSVESKVWWIHKCSLGSLRIITSVWALRARKVSFVAYWLFLWCSALTLISICFLVFSICARRISSCYRWEDKEGITMKGYHRVFGSKKNHSTLKVLVVASICIYAKNQRTLHGNKGQFLYNH